MSINYNASIARDNLLLYFDFANHKCYPGFGNIVYDLSGNNNNGTITGATFNSEKKYFSFDGNGDYIQTDDTLDLGLSDFTLSCWVYISSVQTTGVTFHGILGNKGASGTNAGFSIYWNNNYNKFLFSTADGTTAGERWTVNTWNNIVLDTWTYVVMVRKSGMTNNGCFYINGIYEAIASSVPILNVNSIYKFTLGTNGSKYHLYDYTGNIINTSIYNRALSADEVLQNYEAFKSRFNI